MTGFWEYVGALPDGVAYGALITFMVVAIVKGWLVPRSVHMDRIADKDAQIEDLVEERDNWRAAHDAKSKETAENTAQIAQLLRGVDTTNAILEALRKVTETEPRQGG